MDDILELPSASPKDDASWTIREDSLLGGVLNDIPTSSPIPNPVLRALSLTRPAIPTEPRAMRKIELFSIKTPAKSASLKRNKGSYSPASSIKRRRKRRNDHYSPRRSLRLSPFPADRWDRVVPILSESNSTKITSRQDRITRNKEESCKKEKSRQKSKKLSPNEDESRPSRHSTLSPLQSLCHRPKNPKTLKLETAKIIRKPRDIPLIRIQKTEERMKEKECYNCGVMGHSFMDCVIQCGRCGKDGHKTIWCKTDWDDLNAMDIDWKYKIC